MVERRALERRDSALGPEPQLTLTYSDHRSGALGYLIIDTLDFGRAYGGLRIAEDVSIQSLAPLARLGTIRFQLAGVQSGGAKCALVYNPAAPDRLEQLLRFLRTIRPYLDSVLSLGQDIGLRNDELADALKRIGVRRMGAMQAGTGFSDEDWSVYLSVLADRVGRWTLRELQVPYFAAAATRWAMQRLWGRQDRQRIVVVGLGMLGLHLARLLSEQGCDIIAIANTEVGLHVPSGMGTETLAAVGEVFSEAMASAAAQRGLHSTGAVGENVLEHFSSHLDASGNPNGEILTYSEALRLPCDALVFAEGTRRVDVDDVGKIGARMVVEAAQEGMTATADAILADRGIHVLPNAAVSLGAMIMADAVLMHHIGAESKALLAHLDSRADAIVTEICRLATGLRISLRDATLRVAFQRWRGLPDLSESGLLVPRK